MSEERKYLTIREFTDLGLLQEINRIVMHPAGYALAITKPEIDEQTSVMMTVWDCSEDPEGMLFLSGEIDEAKMASFTSMIERHIPARTLILEGQTVQTPANQVVRVNKDLIPCCEHCPNPVCKTSFFQGGHNGPCTECRDKFKKEGGLVF